MQEMHTPTFGYNSKYLTKDGKPWFPVMGEFHYSRYPREYWKESLQKIKAGGVDIVSSYTIWIHHEEVEGEFDFSGVRDLRHFIALSAEVGLFVCLRIGPWCHGEVRNGGLPDWVVRRNYAPRTNDPAYLADVRRFYEQVYRQAKGYFLHEGGPIMAIQVENEYGHCGGLTGEEGERHMRLLTGMAKEIGFEAPIWTATGWGGAVTGGLIPVMGGYCEAPWDQRVTEIEPSANYLFSYERNDHNIGSDLGIGAGITFDMEKFPYLTAELGGGHQVTHHRRPIAAAEDIGAMSLAKLGSGVNLLGYYMYHGGTNPKGKRTTLQESRATGYLNDLPELCYDFRAPIREYGQISDTFRELKLLAMFLHDFGSELCEMPAYLPEGNPEKPDNQEDLRVSVRHNGKSGYVFVNNYQRRRTMAEHPAVLLKADLPGKTVVFPEIDVHNGDYFFYPFQMKLGGALLKTATATPLCRIEHGSESTFVFYSDKEAKYELEGSMHETRILTLNREDAKNAWKIKSGEGEHLVVSEGAVLQSDERTLHLVGAASPVLRVFPPLPEEPQGFFRKKDQDGFAVYEKQISVCSGSVSFTLLSDAGGKKRYGLRLSLPKGTEDWFINLSYGGDKARLYCGGELCADHFYTGEPWQIGLKRFGFPELLEVEIDELKETAPVFLEKIPPMRSGIACELLSASVEPEYLTEVKL